MPPTTDKTYACPKLSILNGAMGMERTKGDPVGKTLYPAHAPDERGVCRFCQCTVVERYSSPS